MQTETALSCLLIGEGSLLLRCADLLAQRAYRIVAIVTHDQALQASFPIYSSIAEAVGDLRERPDLLFSIVNRFILTTDEIQIATLAAINYHDSPLPRYAGVNAPSWAILHGQPLHGVSWHLLSAGIDTGNILVQHEFAVAANDNALTLSLKCYEHGWLAFAELLAKIEARQLDGYPQELSQRQYYSRSQRLPRQGIIRWSDDAESISRFVRAGQLGPYPNDFGLPKLLLPDGTLVVVGEVSLHGRAVAQPAGLILDVDSASMQVVAGDGVIIRLSNLITPDGHRFDPIRCERGAQLPGLSSSEEESIATITLAASSQEDTLRRSLRNLPPSLRPRFQRLFKYSDSGEYVFDQDIDSGGDFADVAAALLIRLLRQAIARPALLGIYQPSPVGFRSVRPFVCRSLDSEEIAASIQAELDAPPLPADLPMRFSELRRSWLRVEAISVCLSAELDPPISNPGLLICVGHSKLSLRFNSTQFAGEEAAQLASYCFSWSTTPPPHPQASLSSARTVQQSIAHQALLSPDKVAIECGPQTLTYGQLECRCQAIAEYLRSQGAARETLYAILLPQGLEFPAAALAVLKSGAACIPLDVSASLSLLRSILLDARPLAVITTMAYQELAEQLHCDAVYLDSGLPPPLSWREPDVDSGDLAYVIYTSGSTGPPKGCMIEHGALAHFIETDISYYDIRPSDRVLQLCAVTFDASVEEIFATLCAGATLVIRSATLLHSADSFLDFCEAEGLTIVGIYPSLLADVVAAMERRNRFPSTVRIVTTGGEAVPASSVESWRRFFAQLRLPAPHLYNVYGLTETTVANFVADLSLPSESPGEVSIGRPLPGNQYKVVDSSMNAVATGDGGELLLSGAQLARGYWNRPAITQHRFCHDPVDGSRWFRTGDFVCAGRDGSLYFIARHDRQVQVNGIRIELQGVEREILAHPSVSQAAVVVQRDEKAQPLLVAYWVSQAGQNLSPTALRSFLVDRLPAHAIPVFFVGLETMPLTSNGKLHVDGLPSPLSRGKSEARLLPISDDQRMLHQLWAEVLGHANFGVADNLFLVGGNSLAAARLASSLECRFGSQLSVEVIFRHPSIDEQAAWLTARHSDRPSNLVRLQPMGNRLPLFVVHGWGGTVGGFIELARALAPERPVIGVQASRIHEVERSHASVREMARAYADQILDMAAARPVHLLGYSAGGWYAHAVAEALLERGARLGLFAVLDTHATARIHRRLGLMLFARRVMPRFTPSVRGLITPPPGERRRLYLLERFRAVNRHLHGYLRVRVPNRQRLARAFAGSLPASPPAVDPFAQLPWEGYRPSRLPLVVDLFAPPANMVLHRKLWHFYCRGGVRCHPLFLEHTDFFQPELMPELARALELALALAEAPFHDVPPPGSMPG
jgi:amino acid adenylation domain-containing protein